MRSFRLYFLGGSKSAGSNSASFDEIKLRLAVEHAVVTVLPGAHREAVHFLEVLIGGVAEGIPAAHLRETVEHLGHEFAHLVEDIGNLAARPRRCPSR